MTAKRGTAVGGGLFSVKDFSIGMFEYYTPDILNILYAEAKCKWRLGDGLRVNLGAHFTDQRSVGDHLLTGSFVDTQAWGLRAEIPASRKKDVRSSCLRIQHAHLRIDRPCTQVGPGLRGAGDPGR